MKIKLVILPILVAICYISISCVNNSEEDLYGLECDTTDMTYETIKYIFENNCYDCHKNAQGPNSIKFNSYDEVKVIVNTGKLLPAINWTGSKKMPFGQPKLDDCSIDRIEAWINAGMPEN